MKTTALFALAAMIGTAGTIALAGDKDKKSKAEAKYEEVGEPQKCVRLRSIRSTDVVDDETIDFRMTNGKTYRNKLDGGCPGLGFEERFSYRTSLSQLCNVDIIRVLHDYGGRLQEGAGCGLGKFQEIKKISAK